MIGTLPAAVAAESDDIRAERDRARAAAAQAAEDLEPLLAEDSELEKAVDDLTIYVDNQQAIVDAAQQELDATEAAIGDAESRLVRLEQQLELLRDQQRAALVKEFIGIGTSERDRVLEAGSANEANRRSFMFDLANHENADAVDDVRAVEDEVAALELTLEGDRQRVVELREREQQRLDQLEEALAAQESAQGALDDRIAAFQAEVDALEAAAEELEEDLAAAIEAEEAAARPEPPSPGEEPRPNVEPPPNAPESTESLSWPASGTLTSRFGPRWGRNHNGIDIAASTGTPVSAAAAGTVLRAGSYSGYGLVVMIDHGDGLVTVYGHHSSLAVTTGERVSRGQRIGAMGCTGSCTGPHVHFETRINGVPYDPLLFLP